MSATCPACGHTETGESHHPHDRLTAHYATAHARAKACGCQSINGDLWTCDEHSPAYIRERTEWRLANYEARRVWQDRQDGLPLTAGGLR